MVKRSCLFVALAGVLSTDAVKISASKPLNFTALLNGDAIKRKKAEILAKFESAKVEHAKKAEEQEKLRAEEAARKAAEPKPTLKPIHIELPNVTDMIAGNKYLNGSWFEKKFHKDPPPPPKFQCRFPIEGDKVAYVVQGAMTSDAPDSELTDVGIAQARALPDDIRLARALGHGPGRAEVVIMGPMRKTMQTALIAFADKLPDAKWEVNMDVRGIKHESEPVLDWGMSLLSKYNASQNVRDQYVEKVKAGDRGSHEDRWHRFIDSMRARPEKTFIIVTHNYGCTMTKMEIPIGEVRIAGLLADPGLEYGDIAYGGNAWHQLSKPACWPSNVTM